MAGKLSLVIGIFEQPLPLIGAVEELLSQGFTEHDLCISGSVDAVVMAGELLHAQIYSDPRTVSLLVNSQAYSAPESTQRMVGSRGRLLSAWRQMVEPAEYPDVLTSSDVCKNAWLRLIEKINMGCLILLVQTSKKNQLSAASTLLLQRSGNNVQTMECQSPLLDTSR